MPTYDYRCGKCGKRFPLKMTIAEHDASKSRCPKCGSRKVVQEFRGFFAQTSKKS